jgi:hypothetical protein
MRNNRLGCLSATGIITAIIGLLIVVGVAYAGNQALFSPGALSAKTGAALGGVTSHAGIRDCSTCHTAPFSSVRTADRCTQCHTDVAAQLKDPSTLHGAMLKVSGTSDCLACHTEHHGPQAALTITSMVDFPHASLGFSLATHTKLKDGMAFVCADCHPSGYTTYNCDTCHRLVDAAFMDQHITQYGSDCLGCHDGVETVGTGFDHSKTRFLLTGRHFSLSCASCHQDARTLKDMQSTPTACINCHAKDEPHGGRFGTDCGSCHTATAWAPAKFDHNLARFKLTGAHVSVACEACHKNGQFAGTPMDCTSCHQSKSPHGDVYGTADCGACHNPNAWDQVSYDHAHTGFVLDGAHASLSCQQCHDSTPASQISATCGTCHAKDDNHAGRFGSDCGLCHSTTAWKPATFDHARSAFPLTGAHASVPCESCHKNSQFAGTSPACVSCHGDPAYHRGLFGTNCRSCHNTSNWSAKYTGPHPSVGEGSGINHGGASCHTCHPNSLSTYTCLACHSSNHPGDGGGGGG